MCVVFDVGGLCVVYVLSIGVFGDVFLGCFVDECDVLVEVFVESVYCVMKWVMECELECWVECGFDVIMLVFGGCFGLNDVCVGIGVLLFGVVLGVLLWWIDGIVNVVDVGDFVELVIDVVLFFVFL